MIGFLSGVIQSVTLHDVLLNVNGVGYRVLMNAGDLSRARVGAHAEIFCYTHVREDILQLFGFFDDGAREFFEVLIGVSGVGPKGALQILSAGSVNDIRAAIARADVKFLTSAQGVGKKIAERIILELRGKLPDAVLPEDAHHSEAVDALVAMGYRKDAAAEAIRDTEGTTEKLIRIGLKRLHG